ncbi:MAG TPA: formylglycine-generating enzyme family protein [Candidatus Sulfotelmatobacter sp.]|nr:formylglycine-generating enzyme family protein [Candidatus Sulfotelmatobacter sp.]
MSRRHKNKSLPPAPALNAKKKPMRMPSVMLLVALLALGASLISRALSLHARGKPLVAAHAATLPVANPGPPSGAFQPTVENRAPAPGPAPQGMAWIPGGEFSMGANDPPDMDAVGMKATLDARPIHRVYVDGFFMDKTDVTNKQFAEFVKATGYVTVAERKPTAEDFPGAPAENLVAGSVVFSPPDHPVALDNHFQWWSYVKGADWRHPGGPKSSIQGKENYPVVQVAYEDAAAYAKWAGKRLPTEAQWEFAARGGLAGKPFVWGDEFRPKDKWMANTFQGHFPYENSGADGFAGTSPVMEYPPNPYGLYDMAGNVWQWTSDWYRPDYYKQLASLGVVARNPQGPDNPFDPAEPTQAKKVHRGGSFLCTDQYCSRYIVGTRGKGEISTGTNHLGFRCIMTPMQWSTRHQH